MLGKLRDKRFESIAPQGSSRFRKEYPDELGDTRRTVQDSVSLRSVVAVRKGQKTRTRVDRGLKSRSPCLAYHSSNPRCDLFGKGNPRREVQECARETSRFQRRGSDVLVWDSQSRSRWVRCWSNAGISRSQAFPLRGCSILRIFLNRIRALSEYGARIRPSHCRCDVCDNGRESYVGRVGTRTLERQTAQKQR